MSEPRPFDKPEAIQLMRERTLADKCPLLTAHLPAKGEILDVGCSAGPLTLDVASLSPDIRVTGVDVSEGAIEIARQDAVSAQAENVTFMVADAYSLPFDDNTFDLTYALAVLVWLRDPVTAVREQMRVTKPGGQVAASIGDFGTVAIYPRSPNLQKLFCVFSELRHADQDDPFANLHLGREACSLFREAGLSDVNAEAYVPRAEQAHHGSAYCAERDNFLHTISERDGPFARFLEWLVDRSFVTWKEINAAHAEADRWSENHSAFYMTTTVFVHGRVAG